MPRIRPYLVAVSVVALVLLTSLGAATADYDVAPSVESSATEPIDDSLSVAPSVDSTPAHQPLHRSTSGATGAPVTVGAGGGTVVTPFTTGADIVSLGAVDDTASVVTHHSPDVENDPLGPSGLVALAGFSRLDGTDPLDDALRERIYETVESSPGIYPTALADVLDVPRSTVRHHLRVLDRERLVTTHAVDGKRRYVTTQATAAEQALATVDEGTTASGIVDHLARDGPATVSDLADALDRSPGTVSYHLDRLENAAVVDRERDGQAVRNQLSPEVRPLVASISTTGSAPFQAATDD